jgi:hypothetical protein
MGRIVHFVGGAGEGAFPAVVRVTYPGSADGRIDLTAFTADGLRVVDDVPHCDQHADNTWHWPERAPAAPHPPLLFPVP